MLQGAKSILWIFIWHVGDEFHKNFQKLEKNIFIFFSLHLKFHAITAP